MASSASLYKVLGILVSANGNEIKAAYRRLVRTSHPDVVSLNQKDMSANLFMKINAAYSTLLDPNKHADYDKNLYRRNGPFYSSATPPPAAPASGFCGYNSGRNGETDQCW
ncbi:chaperone protein dnaJ 11, chloroplastic-like [Hibiscus syriacus]|uniref:chaperone protein dnaJ 11, chloroplastic-like n=1 Tax=Hibiscus syriacus TaxID=106335 RepID=UPI001923DF11|nr:chaperone protein dnaJ 11, chloroplastic-like [Hibiscus syriacus]